MSWYRIYFFGFLAGEFSKVSSLQDVGGKRKADSLPYLDRD